MRRFYRRGLRSVLQTVALPYGYTITVWSSGQELIHRHGMPPVGDVFLFAAGAVAGFAALRVFIPHATGEEPLPQVAGPPSARAVLIQVAAIGAALGAATLSGLIDSGFAWPVGGFAATELYFAIIALEPTLRAVADGFA